MDEGLTMLRRLQRALEPLRNDIREAADTDVQWEEVDVVLDDLDALLAEPADEGERR